MKRLMHLVLIFLLCLSAACTGCRGKSAEDALLPALEDSDRLIVFTSHKEEVYEPIIREFEERTGIWVEVTDGGTAELLDRIAAGEECDIMFGGGVESYESCKEYFEPYRSSEADLLSAEYVSDGDFWTVFTRLPIVLIYNSKLVDVSEAPEGFSDLLSGDWDGMIAFADPANSGSSYTMLVTMIQAMDLGVDETLGAFAGALDGEMAEGSGDVADQVVSGKRLVGITLEETARKRILAGDDLTIVYPEEGTSAVPDGCAIVQGTSHLGNAKQFVDFIVSEDVQRLAVETMSRRSVRTDFEQEEESFGLIDFDLELAVQWREKILNEWAELMK